MKFCILNSNFTKICYWTFCFLPAFKVWKKRLIYRFFFSTGNDFSLLSNSRWEYNLLFRPPRWPLPSPAEFLFFFSQSSIYEAYWRTICNFSRISAHFSSLLLCDLIRHIFSAYLQLRTLVVCWSLRSTGLKNLSQSTLLSKSKIAIFQNQLNADNYDVL